MNMNENKELGRHSLVIKVVRTPKEVQRRLKGSFQFDGHLLGFGLQLQLELYSMACNVLKTMCIQLAMAIWTPFVLDCQSLMWSHNQTIAINLAARRRISRSPS